MKSKDFAEALRQFADVLAACSSSVPDAAAIRDLASVFEIVPSTSVANVTKRLSTTSFRFVSETPRLGDIARIFKSLQIFLTGKAKAAIVADLKLVESYLATNAHVSVGSLLQQAPQALTSPIKSKAEPRPLRED